MSHSHLDIGFTKPPDEVARDYKDNIDAAIRLARENTDFRWTIESTWMLEEWLRRTDDPGLVAELGKLMRAGNIELGAAFANMHSGLMSAEETNRMVYLGHKFRRQFGVEAPVAFQNDVPGFTWAFPRVFANSQVKYLVTGLNLFIGGGNSLGVKHNPFYWVGPDGSRVLTFFTYDSYVEGYRWKLSGSHTLAELEASVPRRLAWLEQNGYAHDTYLLMASAGDNTHPLQALRTLEQIREWNRKHPELPMKMSTAEEFFKYLEQKRGSDFPAAAGDSSGHWEIVKLRVPEAAARMRQASNALPAAETAAAVASLLTRAPFPRFDFSAAWYALLAFHEHTADAGPGWPGYFSRAETDWSNVAHYAAAMTGFSNVEQQLTNALYRIANPPWARVAATTIIVYNGLSWERSGPIVVDRLPKELHEGRLALADQRSGQLSECEDVPGTRRQILCFVHDIPPLGYRLYSVRKMEGPAHGGNDFPLAARVNGEGTLISLLEKQSGREMLSNRERLFGGLYLSKDRKSFELVTGGAADVHVTEGPLTQRIEVSRKGSALPLSVATIYRNAPYADLRFDVDLSASRSENGQQYAIALPFQKDKQMWVDGAGFVLRMPQDLLPGGAAPQFMPVHFTHFQQGPDWGVTLANRDTFSLRPDLLFVVANEGTVTRTRDEGVQRLSRTEPRGSPVQSFHFRVGIHQETAWRWKRFGAEANLPLRAVVVNGTSIEPSQSFFNISTPAVQLLVFKPAEQRPGWHVLRLQDISGAASAGVKVNTLFKIAEAVRANLVEEPAAGKLDLANISLKPWETLTILVRITGM
jgi:hypothetical protein